jgi:hypothetical protein
MPKVVLPILPEHWRALSVLRLAGVSRLPYGPPLCFSGPTDFWTKLVKEETMSKGWLSGVLIFVLGFGCPSLATNATAQERAEDRGELEDGLSYINTERDITLVNTGKYVYLVIVQREPGTIPVELPFSSSEGILKILQPGLSRAIAFRLEPVQIMEELVWRPCMGADCSFIGPLPPPPPPTDYPVSSAVILQPQQ